MTAAALRSSAFAAVQRKRVLSRRLRRRTDAAAFLCAYLFLVFVIPSWLVVGPLGAAGSPATIAGYLAFAWWVSTRSHPNLGGAIGPQPVRVHLFLFGAAILASYLAAFSRPILPLEAASADRGLLCLASWAGIALIAADGIDSLPRLERVISWMASGAAFLAAIGLVTFLTGLNVVAMMRFPGLTMNGDLSLIDSRSVYRRIAGTAAHPIEFGIVLTIILPLALHRAFSSGRRPWPWVRVALIAMAIPASVSRSAILGLIVGFAVLMVGWPGARRVRVLMATPLFVVAVRVMAPGLLGTLRGLFLDIGSDPSFQGRTSDYARAYSFIFERLATGRGFRTFLPTQYFYLDNQYLGTLIETGFLGFVTLLVLLAGGVLTARGARRRSTDPEIRDLGLSLSAAVVVAATGMATFDTLSFPMASGIIFLVLGCCGALWRISGGSFGGVEAEMVRARLRKPRAERTPRPRPPAASPA